MPAVFRHTRVSVCGRFRIVGTLPQFDALLALRSLRALYLICCGPRRDDEIAMQVEDLGVRLSSAIEMDDAAQVEAVCGEACRFVEQRGGVIIERIQGALGCR